MSCKNQLNSIKLWGKADKFNVGQILAENRTLTEQNEKLNREVQNYKLLRKIFGDEQAENMFNQLVKEICEDENINEELKEKDQICWVRSMNNVYNRATELVTHELIYT